MACTCSCMSAWRSRVASSASDVWEWMILLRIDCCRSTRFLRLSTATSIRSTKSSADDVSRRPCEARYSCGDEAR